MKRICLVLFLLLTGTVCNAQISHTYFDHIGLKEGLPEAYQRAIVENEGYIWIATQNGLIRFDGYEYKNYPLGNNRDNLYPANNVVSIIADISNDIWVTVIGNGLFRYNKQTDSFEQFKYPKAIAESRFDAEVSDNSGNIWGIYLDGKEKIARFDIKTRRFELFGKSEKDWRYINAAKFYPVQKTMDGHIWFGTNNGLYRYNGPGKQFSAYLASNDTAKQRGANPIYETPTEPGVFWINTFHGNNLDLRITRLDTHTNTIKDYKSSNMPDSALSAGVNSIYEDKSKRLWFGTDAGLTELNRHTAKFTNYTLQDTVKAAGKNTLSDFCETKKGSFWLTSPNGLVYFDPSNGHFERSVVTGEAGSLGAGGVAVKMLDHTDQLWAANAFNGISKVNRLKSAFQVAKFNTSSAGSYPGRYAVTISAEKGFARVVSIKGVYNWYYGNSRFKNIYAPPAGQLVTGAAVSSDSTLYVTTSNGLVVFNLLNHKQDHYTSNQKDSTTLITNYIRQPFIDHTGTVWLLTNDNKGINSFNPKTKKFTRYPYLIGTVNRMNNSNGGTDDSSILAIYEDHNNTLWVGTNFGGLNRFDRTTGRFVSYFNEKNKSIYCVNTIYEDSKGRFWVGTYLTGLFEFDRKTGTYVKHLDVNSGLLINTVGNIVEDAAGRLWIDSPRGLTRLDPETMKVTNFKTDNILPGTEAFDLNSLPLKDGRFVISEKNAMAIFDPKDLDDNPYPPIVHIESLLHNNPESDDKNAVKTLAYARTTLELPYNQNRIQFNYIALHYDNPAQNTYAYRLDGYDKQWVQAGTIRSATYTNLSPGTYTFHVKAANSSGVWNNTGDSVIIIIHPPWWFTWWAWLLWIILFVSAISLFVKYRSRKLLLENQLLEEKISLRTQQLIEANKDLSEQREEIITQRDQLSETVTDLKNTQQQLIQSEKLASLGELTAGIAHEIQNPLNFVNNFSEVSAELADEITEELKTGDVEEAIAIVADIKLNLEKIIHHGKRADGIVKNMLQHSRQNSGEKELTDINDLTDECLRLSYHGLRAKDKSFNADMVTVFDPGLPQIAIIPQDISRVLVNLFNNAFYAVKQKQKTAGPEYKLLVTVTTTTANGFIEIAIKDNGTGMTTAVKDKIMQPFFTTKPTGEGTGLGLSLSYDIIIKGHNGKIDVNTRDGDGSEFRVLLPVG